ncbi:MAG TPA: hypothetical protein VEJ67_12350 [Candidatus Cybelea sp.]|nr:hypothetical protein [Candidatus Cybelea sp.]
MTNHALADQTDFSLARGGPLYHLYLRTKLARPSLDLVVRRVVVVSLFCWGPPFLLALLAGQAFGNVSIPFLPDLGVHTRFLLAVPLLIASELIVHQRLKTVVQQFYDRGIIHLEDHPRFEAALTSTKKLRDSTFAEIVILLISIAIGYWTWQQSVVTGASSWYATTEGGSSRLTAAGIWYGFVSLPILRFILLRWYYRIFIWYRFLWKVRSLPLYLNLFHPDRAGGLGFLRGSLVAFTPVLVAQTVLLAGIIGDQMWYLGKTLSSFKMEIVSVVAFLVLVVLVPLGFFLLHLARGGRRARRELGVLASHYVREFHRKWIEGHSSDERALLGTPDIQSLADLIDTYKAVGGMRLLPVGKEAILRLTLVVALPFFPLLLTMIPLDKIVDRLIKLVF